MFRDTHQARTISAPHSHHQPHHMARRKSNTPVIPDEPAQLARTLTLMVLDVIAVAVAYLLALLLRYDFEFTSIDRPFVDNYCAIVVPMALVVVVVFWLARLYHSVWSYASMVELERLVGAWGVAGVLFMPLSWAMGVTMPRSFWAFGGVLGFGATTLVRFSRRIWDLFRLAVVRRANRDEAANVMLIGAGETGRALLREIRYNPSMDLVVRCAIDDDPAKVGRDFEGVPVVGGRASIAEACERYRVSQIVFAIPSLPGADRRDILRRCQETGCEVRVVPGLRQLVDGQVEVAKLREVRLEDLLGRDPVVVDDEQVRELVHGKVVLVTGGGGSIGSELCRQVAALRPRRLVILDVYENGAYDLQQELRRAHPGIDLSVLVGSVRDAGRVEGVFAEVEPDVVFHAAAHKHVPLMEGSPAEAVKNNVFGTLNVAEAALAHGAGKFVLISTDKAVNPTNVMGATKRACEMVVQSVARRAAAEGAPTDFAAVRFGNVLGSNGSVVPLFERQIAEGGPVTVTDRRITRYFMTIPEAVSLVLQAACYARGGEIFVLDMGEPVRIDDMARQLIRLAGYEPDEDIRIVYTGLRPGEKLYEERLMDEEGLERTENELISIARPIEMDDAEFAEQLEVLREVAESDGDVRATLAVIVPTYHPNSDERAA